MVGGATQPGQEVLTYTGSVQVVTLELNVSEQRLAVKDTAVGVKLPDGRTIAGKIAKTATVIKLAEGNNPATTKIRVTVTIDDEKALAGVDQASVDVVFTASSAKTC